MTDKTSTEKVPRHSLQVTGLTDDVDDPTWGKQYAVRDRGKFHAYGDQSWVAYGGAIRDAHPDGEIWVRDISISYGEWRPS